MPKDGLKQIKYKLNEGDIKGKYKLLKLIKIEKSDGKFNRKWLCENIYTKEQKILSNDYLGNYVEKHHNKTKNKDIQIGIRNKLYSEYKRNALKRNINFELSFDEFDEITNKNCLYCNSEPKEIDINYIKQYGCKSQPTIYKNGIDRINNDEGYTKENCVPCCSKCNMMKRDNDIYDFLKQIELIYENKVVGGEGVMNMIDLK